MCIRMFKMPLTKPVAFFPVLGGCFFPKAQKGDKFPESFEMKRMSFLGGDMQWKLTARWQQVVFASLNILTFEETSTVMSDIVFFALKYIQGQVGFVIATYVVIYLILFYVPML